MEIFQKCIIFQSFASIGRVDLVSFNKKCLKLTPWETKKGQAPPGVVGTAWWQDNRHSVSSCQTEIRSEGDSACSDCSAPWPGAQLNIGNLFHISWFPMIQLVASIDFPDVKIIVTQKLH